MIRDRLVAGLHRRFSLGVVAVVFGAALSSCKQGRGDRCQIDDDCGSGLICNKATSTCQDTSGGGDIDATVPDVLTNPPDASVDAPTSSVDASIDAPGEPL